MKFDDILRHLGQFGRYQRQQYVMLSMVIFSCGIQVMMTIFTLAVPDHRCAIPDLENDTYRIQNPQHAHLIDRFIPLVKKKDADVLSYSTCDMYQSPSTMVHSYIEPNSSTVSVTVQVPQNTMSSRNSSGDSLPQQKCSAWVFDRSEFTSTISTQMRFVCGREILKSHALMTLMSGQMIGCLVVGPLADVLGRKRMMMLTLVVHFVASVTISWAVNVFMLGATYLLNGMAISGAYCTSFTLGMELIGPKWRHATGIGITGFWSLGMLWVCFLAYFLRDWQHLQLAASCPIALFAVYFFLVPESARWLIHKGRFSEVDAIIAHAAKVNKKTVPESMLNSETQEEPKVKTESLLTLIKNPPLLIRAVIVFLNWFASSLTYYGLSLNVGQLSGNIFINFSLAAVFELIAYAVIIFCLGRIGRKALYCCSILLGSASCILTLFPVLYADKSTVWVVRLLAMIGKFGVSGAFAIIWMFTCEMFPTSLRASITGTSSAIARIGGVVASYVANLNVEGDIGKVLPQIVLGTCGLVAGLLALFLPETFKKKLPETVEDAIQISSFSGEFSGKGESSMSDVDMGLSEMSSDAELKVVKFPRET